MIQAFKILIVLASLVYRYYNLGCHTSLETRNIFTKNYVLSWAQSLRYWACSGRCGNSVIVLFGFKVLSKPTSVNNLLISLCVNGTLFWNAHPWASIVRKFLKLNLSTVGNILSKVWCFCHCSFQLACMHHQDLYILIEFVQTMDLSSFGAYNLSHTGQCLAGSWFFLPNFGGNVQVLYVQLKFDQDLSIFANKS